MEADPDFDAAEDRASAEAAFGAWRKEAEASGSDWSAFLELSERHRDGILAYFVERRSSGPVEGLNKKARVILKRSYGLKSCDALWTRRILEVNWVRERIGRTIWEMHALANRIWAAFCGYYTLKRKNPSESRDPKLPGIDLGSDLARMDRGQTDSVPVSVGPRTAQNPLGQPFPVQAEDAQASNDPSLGEPAQETRAEITQPPASPKLPGRPIELQPEPVQSLAESRRLERAARSQPEAEQQPNQPSRPRRPEQSRALGQDRPKPPEAGGRSNPNRPAEFPSGTDLGGPLIPGQARYPINLPCALRLAGARSIEIRIAQERIGRAIADWEQARVAFLPTLTAGLDYIRHDGRAQMVNGPIFNVSKSSLFAGTSAAAGDGFPGPPPAGGPAPVNSLAMVFNFSDAFFLPLATRQVIRARRSEADATAHDVLLNVSEVYFNLLTAQGQRAIAREAFNNARELARILESYVRSGLGLEADYRRALTEVDTRRRDVEYWEGQFEVASADLVRLLRLDPTTVLDPMEPSGILVRWLEDQRPLGELIALGLRNRPELASNQALVEAARLRERAVRLHPFLPGAVVRFSGGTFGGGSNSVVDSFGGRSDLEASLFWELRNLGLGDLAQVHAARSERTLAALSLARAADLVAAEVTQADKQVHSARRQVEEAGRTIPQAFQSVQLNFQNIRRAAGLPLATIPLNVLQPIQALTQARSSYLQAVTDYNGAQFRLYRSIGYPPVLSAPQGGQLPNCSLPVPPLPKCALPIPLRACDVP